MSTQPHSPPAAQRFLTTFEREHATTLKVLRAYPPDRAELRPHPRCKTAKELAWGLALEMGLGTMIMQDAFREGVPSGELPQPPEHWDDILVELQRAYDEYTRLIAGFTKEQLQERVSFMAGPHQMATFPREEILWMLLFDMIHHRGQFSIYLRMADGRVPSIYGPSGDEPWL